jgi:hypothetical protein
MAHRAGAIRQLLEPGLLDSVNPDDPGLKRLDRRARSGRDPAYNCGVFEEKEQ